MRCACKARTAAQPGKFAAVEGMFPELDDFFVHFGTTAAGKRFMDAWFKAWNIEHPPKTSSPFASSFALAGLRFAPKMRGFA